MALKAGDVDYTAGQVRVNRGKGAKDRIVPVDGEKLAYLRAWSEKRAALGLNARQPPFCRLRRQGFGEGSVGSPMSADNVQALVTRLARAAGIERHVTPHILRHTHACKLLRRPGATLTDDRDLPTRRTGAPAAGGAGRTGGPGEQCSGEAGRGPGQAE